MSQFPARLTAHEINILCLVAEGDKNDVIAKKLHISPDTVKTHLRRIQKKLDTRCRTQSAIVADRMGLLDGAGKASAVPPVGWAVLTGVEILDDPDDAAMIAIRRNTAHPARGARRHQVYALLPWHVAQAHLGGEGW